MVVQDDTRVESSELFIIEMGVGTGVHCYSLCFCAYVQIFP